MANTLDIATQVNNIGLKSFLLATILLNFSGTPINPIDFRVNTIVIDPGHGGHDPGTRGKKALEKEVALKISLKVGEYIEKNIPGVKVIFTRKGDQYVALDERAILANKSKADLFICIHANAVANAKAYGTETYVMGISKAEKNFDVAKRENSVMLKDENYEQRYEGFDPTSPESYILFSLAQSAYQESSLLFASLVEKEFKNNTKRYSRGVRQAPFWVLWRTSMPSVLIETGFLTYPEEEKFLSSKSGQDSVALGIYRAFKEYKTQIESIN